VTVDADAVELRVLGCLIEKQRTTPDQYPLSLNALRAACNQATNRDPVVDYDEATIRGGLERLSRRGWVRLASGPGSRAVKYRHLFDDALALSDEDMALLTVLMLRGAQTPGELKQRTERMLAFPSVPEVIETLQSLIRRELVQRLERRPGQKEERYRQLLGGNGAEIAVSAVEPADDRVEALEARVDRLEDEVASLRSALDALQPPARR
jgi:uncharacterized protein